MTDTPTGRTPRPLSGHIDSVTRDSDGLHVVGWTIASRVTLCCGGKFVSTAPNILRPDAAEALSVAPDAARCGFDITLPDPGTGPALMVYEPPTGGIGDLTAVVVPGTGDASPDSHPMPWIPRRVAGVFDRYVSEHLDCDCPGHGLTDAKGTTLGHIDRIRVNGTRMTVEGWANARRVILVTGDRRRVAEPQLPRLDVAEATGLPADLGFYLEAVGPGAHETGDTPILIVEPKSGPPSPCRCRCPPPGPRGASCWAASCARCWASCPRWSSGA